MSKMPEVFAATQARSDAEFAGRTPHPDMRDASNVSSIAWSLIAITERLDKIATILYDAELNRDMR